jgi:hypothetical protein
VDTRIRCIKPMRPFLLYRYPLETIAVVGYRTYLFPSTCMPVLLADFFVLVSLFYGLCFAVDYYFIDLPM